MKYKKCGQCEYFLKIKSLTKYKGHSGAPGICEFTDTRTSIDMTPNCKHWKGKRYKRK